MCQVNTLNIRNILYTECMINFFFPVNPYEQQLTLSVGFGGHLYTAAVE